MNTGRVFQTIGPSTEKARQLYVLSWNRNTISRWGLEECRFCHLSAPEAGVQYCDRYGGARLFRHWWTVTASLKSFWSGMSSQWSSSCSVQRRLRSDFWVPVTARAAAFNTHCDLSVVVLVSDGVHTGITLRIRLINLCSSGDTASHYCYCSSLLCMW